MTERSRVLRMAQAFGTSLIVVAVLATAFASGFLHNFTPDSSSAPATPTPMALPVGLKFDYVVTIVMENQDRCAVLTTCGGTATYMTSLATGSDTVSDSGQATDDRYCYVHPS